MADFYASRYFNDKYFSVKYFGGSGETSYTVTIVGQANLSAELSGVINALSNITSQSLIVASSSFEVGNLIRIVGNSPSDILYLETSGVSPQEIRDVLNSQLGTQFEITSGTSLEDIRDEFILNEFLFLRTQSSGSSSIPIRDIPNSPLSNLINTSFGGVSLTRQAGSSTYSPLRESSS